jgi:3-methyladenine DNA glycosylase/8-oxoguanine DNA glycosylase
VSLRHTVESHGWYGLAPWRWNDDSGLLSRPEPLPSGAIARIEAGQETSHSIRVTANGLGSGPGDMDAARAMVVRWLSVEWDPGPAVAVASRVNEAVATAIGEGHGRFLRGSTFYEDFAKTVCTIQIAWSGTRRMVTALVDAIGGGVFPTPRNVLDAGEAALRADAGLGFRAPQLVAATEMLLQRGLMDEAGRGVEALITREELIGLPGIGPYAAGHVAMLLHDYSRIPVDSAVSRFFRERYGLAPDRIEPFFDKWGDYRFLGYRLSAR